VVDHASGTSVQVSAPKPIQCYGPAAEQHKKGCRKDRPLCRWARKAYAAKKFGAPGPCYCSAYHFPHRLGAGDCAARGGAGVPAGLLESEAEYHERKAYQERREPGRISSVVFEKVPDRWLSSLVHPDLAELARCGSRAQKKSLCHCRRMQHHDWCRARLGRRGRPGRAWVRIIGRIKPRRSCVAILLLRGYNRRRRR
jgi:hypothetical protein